MFDALFGSVILATALTLASYSVQKGQKSADYAWYGNQALVIAEDIASRIRINTNSATAYTNNTIWLIGNPVCSECSSLQRVEQDGYEVGRMIALALPDAGTSVNQCGVHLCIVVWWQSKRPIGNDCIESCIKLTIQV